jgi:hypothetical protein
MHAVLSFNTTVQYGKCGTIQSLKLSMPIAQTLLRLKRLGGGGPGDDDDDDDAAAER